MRTIKHRQTEAQKYIRAIRLTPEIYSPLRYTLIFKVVNYWVILYIWSHLSNLS